VADAATTGTLVVVAVSGGAGAFLGAALGQAVQLHRDRKQREHENARHDREREQSLEDQQRARREDRYVSLLTELTRMNRSLDDTTLMVDEVVLYREHAEGPEAVGGGEVERAIADVSAKHCTDSWRNAEKQHEEVSTAFFAAYAVASRAVREAGMPVVDWAMAITAVKLAMLKREQKGPYYIALEPDSRWVDRREYAAHITGSIGALRDRIAELDRLLREELRLD
jgi:hypothetical protein